MNTLHTLAIKQELIHRKLASGSTVEITALTIGFEKPDPPKLPAGTLHFAPKGTAMKGTYLSKPLVIFDNQVFWGELAIVHTLINDGWQAVWVDTFHGRKFWQDMPNRARPVDLAQLEPNAHSLYQDICRENGGPGGFFDVFAWRKDEVIFLQYKDSSDSANKNEPRWLESALKVGIPKTSLYLIIGQ